MGTLLLAVSMFIVGALAYYAFGSPGASVAIVAGALAGLWVRRRREAQQARSRGDGTNDT